MLSFIRLLSHINRSIIYILLAMQLQHLINVPSHHNEISGLQYGARQIECSGRGSSRCALIKKHKFPHVYLDL